MAITYPAYKPTAARAVETAGAGAETAAGVALLHSSVVTDTITSGALVGLALKHTTNAGATEKVIVRIYRGSAKTDLVMETEISFVGANDQAYIQPDLPIPFFAGLFATTSSAAADGGTGAVESVEIKPDVLGIAGNN